MKSRATWLLLLAITVLGVGPSGQLVHAADTASSPPRPASHCTSGETIEFSCSIGRKLASVCSTPRKITYRFGLPRHTELEIASDGADGRVHFEGSTVTENGYQDHLRFSRVGAEYIVFTGGYGASSKTPGRIYSGVAVYQDGKLVLNRECSGRGVGRRLKIEGLPAFVPRNADERFQAIY